MLLVGGAEAEVERGEVGRHRRVEPAEVVPEGGAYQQALRRDTAHVADRRGEPSAARRERRRREHPLPPRHGDGALDARPPRLAAVVVRIVVVRAAVRGAAAARARVGRQLAEGDVVARVVQPPVLVDEARARDADAARRQRGAQRSEEAGLRRREVEYLCLARDTVSGQATQTTSELTVLPAAWEGVLTLPIGVRRCCVPDRV